MKIAVIGAGLSGVVAAKTLSAELGNEVKITIFEKARGLGGRMSTRRAGAFEFDHGAQYFTAKEHQFKMAVDTAISQGHVAPWESVAKYFKNGKMDADTGAVRYVATPRMNSWIKAMADELTIKTTARVRAMTFNPDAIPNGSWSLYFEDGSTVSGFNYVIVAVPAPQAERLLLPSGFRHIRSITSVLMEPCFAVMIGFDKEIKLPWQTLRRDDGPASWFAVNGTKPGRPKTGTTLVIHAGPEWSAANIDRNISELQSEILDEVSTVIETDVTAASYAGTHRWLYAAVSKSSNLRCLADANLGVIACGDWCHGGRIEGAYLSGHAAANEILEWII